MTFRSNLTSASRVKREALVGARSSPFLVLVDHYSNIAKTGDQ